MKESIEILMKYFQSIIYLIEKNTNYLIDNSLSLLVIMMTIDLVLGVLLRLEEDTFMLCIKKILPYGFFYYIIDNFITIKGYIYNGFLWIPNKLMGFEAKGSFDFANFANDAVLMCSNFLSGVDTTLQGEMKTNDIFEAVFTGEKISSNPFLYITNYLIAFMVLIVLGMVIIDIMMAVVEFHIISVMALMLLPFGVFEKTKFIGDKAFSGIINTGIRLGITISVYNICQLTLAKNTVKFENMKDTSSLLGFFLVMMFTLLLAKNGKAMAQSFSGSTGSTGDFSQLISGAKQTGEQLSMLAKRMSGDTKISSMTSNSSKNTVSSAKAGTNVGGITDSSNSTVGKNNNVFTTTKNDKKGDN